MAEAYLIIPMAPSMRACGETIGRMVEAVLFTLMAVSTKKTGRMAREMDKAATSLKDVRMKVNFMRTSSMDWASKLIC